MQSPLKEAILAFLRILVVAAVPILAIELSEHGFQWKPIALGLAIGLLKAIDEYIHTYGKNEGNESLIKGLTRF